MADANVRFVICGGVACILQGVARTTHDLDVRVALETPDLEALVRVARALDLRPRVPEPIEALFDAERRRAWVEEKSAGPSIRCSTDTRDSALRRLVADRDAITGSPGERVRAFVDRALDDDGPLVRGFWLAAAGDIILAGATGEHRALYDLAARRIHATFRVDLRERHQAVRVLAEHVVPFA